MADQQGPVTTYRPPCNVAKFDGHDFHKWKKQMTFYLKDADLWEIVDGEPPAVDDRTPQWNRRNDSALGAIYNSCQDDQQEVIDDCITAHEAWNTLSSTFSQSSAGMVNKLLDDLNDIRKTYRESVSHYIARGKSIARAIKSAGENCSERYLINRILAGLPAEFDNARNSIATNKDLNLESITGTLLEVEARMASRRRRSLSPRSRDIRDSRIREPRSIDFRQTDTYRPSDPYRPADPTRPSDPPRPPDSRPTDPYRPSTSRRWCSHCNRPGHLIHDCWELYPDRRRNFAPRGYPPPSQPPAPPAPYAPQPQAAMAQQSTDTTDYLTSSTTINNDNLYQYWDQAMLALRSDMSDLKDSMSIQLPGQWLIDSGCSSHYTASRHILSDFSRISPLQIITGNGHITAQGIGSVTIHSSLGTRKLSDVLWVPNLAGKHHLLSIPQLIRKGCSIVMNSDSCEITDTNSRQPFLTGSFDGNGFYVNMSVCKSTTHVPHPPSSVPIAMMGGTEDTQPLEIWHMRLGHLNERAIKQLVHHSTGMTIGPPSELTLSMKCEPCLRGSQHRQISYFRGNPASKLLEHVWADVKGPLLQKDVHGFRYFVVFVDEKSRYTFTYPLLEKSDVFPAFKLFESRTERLTGSSILHLHVDVGGEWVSGDMRAHCRNRGIEILFTSGYAPNMNSIAERSIRSIIEHASSLLWAAFLPVGFWVCAVRTSVYLLNRSPHSALNGMTPFEAWFGKLPNLGHLRVFGCKAAAHIPDELRTKTLWTSKSSTDCIFVGYSDTENLFELWDIHKKAILRKRDVIFWEHDLGHPLLSDRALPHGISIYTGVAGEMIPAISSPSSPDTSVPIPRPSEIPSDLNNPLPLLPLPTQQTISRLPPEPTSGWIHSTPEDIAADIQRTNEKRHTRTLPIAMTVAPTTDNTPVRSNIVDDTDTECLDSDIRQCFETLLREDQDHVPHVDGFDDTT